MVHKGDRGGDRSGEELSDTPGKRRRAERDHRHRLRTAGSTSTGTPPRFLRISGRKWTRYFEKEDRFHEDTKDRHRRLCADEGAHPGDCPWHLLELIAPEQPGSLTELARLAGRSKSNLSQTLKTMSRYGLVELEAGERGRLVPRVPYQQIRLDVSLTKTSIESVGASP